MIFEVCAAVITAILAITVALAIHGWQEANKVIARNSRKQLTQQRKKSRPHRRKSDRRVQKQRRHPDSSDLNGSYSSEEWAPSTLFVSAGSENDLESRTEDVPARRERVRDSSGDEIESSTDEDLVTVRISHGSNGACRRQGHVMRLKSLEKRMQEIQRNTQDLEKKYSVKWTEDVRAANTIRECDETGSQVAEFPEVLQSHATFNTGGMPGYHERSGGSRDLHSQPKSHTDSPSDHGNFSERLSRLVDRDAGERRVHHSNPCRPANVDPGHTSFSQEHFPAYRQRISDHMHEGSVPSNISSASFPPDGSEPDCPPSERQRYGEKPRTKRNWLKKKFSKRALVPVPVNIGTRHSYSYRETVRMLAIPKHHVVKRLVLFSTVKLFNKVDANPRRRIPLRITY